VTAGTATFGTGEKTISVGAGDLLWWNPGQDHELCSASEDFDLYVAGLSPGFSERVLGVQSAAIQRGPLVAHLATDQVTRLFPFCQLQDCSTDDQACETRVGDFWRRAHELRLVAAESHSITQRSLRLVQARPDLYRAEVAKLARVHPTEVSRYFHRDMGMTLSAYRTRLRILRFIQLVDSGSRSLLAASTQAGFGSYSQCHRVFQQTLGHSPRTYFSTQVRQALEGAYAVDVSAGFEAMAR